MERNHSVDIARGFAISLMVVGHCYSSSNFILQIIYAFHMPFFFMVSGLLVGSGQKFSLKKQLMRTLIPYYCFELLYDCFIAALSIKHPDLMVTVFKERILKTVIFGGSTVTWFLPCMLLVKVIFELLRKTKNWQIPITIGLYLAGLLLPTNGIQIIIIRSFVGLGFYSAGYYCSKYEIQKRMTVTVSAVLEVIFIAFALLNGQVSLFGAEYSNMILYTVNGVLGSLLLLQLSKWIVDTVKHRNKVLKLIELFGKNSIVILCTHMFFVELIRMIDAKACGSFLPKLGYAEGIIFATLILLCELIVIKLCNKYFWFAFGRSKPKKVLANE